MQITSEISRDWGWLRMLGFLAAGSGAWACSDGAGPGTDADEPANGTLTAPTDTLLRDPVAYREAYRAALVDSDYLRVPGVLTHRSCVHEVPDGATVGRRPGGGLEARIDGKVVASYEPCSYPRFRGDGSSSSAGTRSGGLDGDVNADDPELRPAVGPWVTFSRAQAPNNGGRAWFNQITGEWTVPPEPPFTGALIYMFNGLVSTGNADWQIIQPVLQYGVGAAGGGPIWAIASWWVENNSGLSLHSTLKTVSVGGTIRGATTRVGGDNGQPGSCDASGNCDWLVNTRQVSPSVSTSILVDNSTLRPFTEAEQAVLEVYHIARCGNFPVQWRLFLESAWRGSTTFTSTMLYQPPRTGDQNNFVEMYWSATWSREINGGSPDCGYAVDLTPRGAKLTY